MAGVRLGVALENGKLNCWDYQMCGRGSADGGSCPASAAETLDGAHGGHNGGRACWVVTDTLCEGHDSGSYEHKIATCRKCAFYHRVAVEEGLDHREASELLGQYREDAVG